VEGAVPRLADRQTSTHPNLRWAWLVLGAIGVAARLWLWWASIGSYDVYLWMRHAQYISTYGLAATYKDYAVFNHPPLMGLYAAQAWRWSSASVPNFARLIKLPGLAGEAISLWALWKFSGPRVFALYACLPAAILVSGFHGNTDSLCAALVLVAAIVFDRKRYFTSGLLWSAALNVKLFPLILLPLPLFGTHKWRDFWRLCVGFAVGLVPFIPPVLRAAHAMYHNFLSYSSNFSDWGIPGLVNAAIDVPKLRPYFLPVERWYSVNGRYLILATVVALATVPALRKSMNQATQAALGAALFLLLASGFGVQYVEFAAPLLCYADIVAGLCWGWTSGLFIGVVYWMSSTWHPFQSIFPPRYLGPAPLLGMLAWAALAHFVWVHVRAGLRTQRKHIVCEADIAARPKVLKHGHLVDE